MTIHIFKYMNSGAGGIAGYFIHERLFEECKNYPRLSGWWSHKMSTRFEMTNGKLGTCTQAVRTFLAYSGYHLWQMFTWLLSGQSNCVPFNPIQLIKF